MHYLCFGPECTYRGTKVVKHPFYSIGTKMIFGSVQSILLTFGTYKMQNLCSSLNALFRGTEVAMHPFYSIGPKNDIWECFGVFC
jgi:hypothetical protein